MTGSPSPTECPIGRVAAAVTWFLVIGVGQALMLLPGGVAALFLDRDPSNLPLLWALLLPAGPAIAAGLATMRARESDPDPGPVAAFVRGVRLNWWDALRVWGLGTGLVALLGFNAAIGPAIGLPAAYGVAAVVLGVVLLAWTLLGLAISAHATFRFRDVLRLAGYYLLTRPLVALGVVGVVLLAAMVVVATFDAVLALLAWLLTVALHVVTRPVITDLMHSFIAEVPNHQSPTAGS